MSDPQHPILAYWSSLPLYLRIIVCAVAGLLFGAILLGGFSSLWGALLGVLGVARKPDPPARDPGPELADTIRRRERWEAEQAEARLQEARQAERLERRNREQKAKEQAEDEAAAKAAASVPPGEPQKNAILEACRAALEAMQKDTGDLKIVAWVALSLLPAMLLGCAYPHAKGAGDSMPTQTCFSQSEGATILAQLQRCAALPKRCVERCHLAIESEKSKCEAGLRSSSATLQICRMERDAALARKCPACAKCGSTIWPVIVAGGVGLIVGIGVGVAVGVMVGK